MLGNIVAKVSGMSFPDFLRKRIFSPLKMNHTVAYVPRKKHSAGTRLRIRGADWSSNFNNEPHPFPFVEQDQSSTSATLGDGGIYSNLEDLAKWDDALAHHTLLSEEEMKLALTAFKLPNGELPKWSGDSGDTDPQHGKPVEYGFGWYLDDRTDHRPLASTHVALRRNGRLRIVNTALHERRHHDHRAVKPRRRNARLPRRI